MDDLVMIKPFTWHFLCLLLCLFLGFPFGLQLLLLLFNTLQFPSFANLSKGETAKTNQKEGNVCFREKGDKMSFLLPQIFLKMGQTWRCCWCAHQLMVNTEISKEKNISVIKKTTLNRCSFCLLSYHSEWVFKRFNDALRFHLSYRHWLLIIGSFWFLQKETSLTKMQHN